MERAKYIINNVLDGINITEVINYTIDEFVVHKKKKHRVDPRLSAIAKKRFRRYRSKMVTGLRKFHKSSSGKQLHRAIGKYNVSHS